MISNDALMALHGGYSEHTPMTIQAKPATPPVDSVITCRPAVNELITNAEKHASPASRPGEVTVCLTQEPDHTILASVADTLIILPANLDVTSTPTSGLQPVTLRADQPGGKVMMDSTERTEFLLGFSRTKQEYA